MASGAATSRGPDTCQGYESARPYGQCQHMAGTKSNTLTTVALQALDFAERGDLERLPDWIMLLPPLQGGKVTTVDGRGPYTVDSLDRLATESLQAAGGKLAIDENHSTDLAAPRGEPAPARGWVDKLEVRDGALWGRVAWTESGKALMSDRAYRGISPVIIHGKTFDVWRIARASLTNKPNLRGMSALHATQEDDMEEFLAKLRAALGLDEKADMTAVLEAISKLKGDNATALQSQLAPIVKAAGLKNDASAADVVTAITALSTAGNGDATKQVAALQSELAGVTTQLNALRDANAKDRATAFVDGAIKMGRVGVKPMRDHYIAMHAQDPARVEKEINALPVLGSDQRIASETPPPKDGEVALNAEQKQAAKLLGVTEKDFAATLQAETAQDTH